MHSNNYISESTKERLNCNIVPASSVIFAKIGAAIFLERKRLSTKECCIDNNMMAFSPNEYIDAIYICFLLQTISFGELVEATALPSLGTKILGSIILKVPNTLNEQQAIATILSDMDKEIAELEAQRDKYRLVKSGMMQKLLTGEIRLRKE
jgi:type I restriction enzyme S subunit